MKSELRIMFTAVILFLITNVNFGQTAPNLGATSSFALFTGTGAFDNLGATKVTGDIGSNTYSPTGFPPGTITGNIYNASDPITATAAADVLSAYSDLTQSGTVKTGVLDGLTLSPGVYAWGAATSLGAGKTLTLDGGGDPNALFVIRIDGALATGTLTEIVLTNSATFCNVYWQINGAFTLGDNSIFRGTVIATGAIHLLEGSSLFGRGLSTTGAIDTHNNIVTNFQCTCVAPAAPTASVTTQPTCIVPTGTITVTAPANGSGISYTVTGINPVVTAVTNATGSFTGLTPGVYDVTTTKAECVSTATQLTVKAVPEVPAAPTASVTIQPTCIIPTGTITVTAPANGPDISYTVTGINPVVAAVTNTTGLFPGLAPGVYNVTTTNAGCVSPPTQLTVKAVPGAPAAPTASVTTQPTCIVSTGTITVTAPANGPGITYTVTGITPAVAALTNSTGLFTGLTPGNYNVTTNNGVCVSAATKLTVKPIPGAPAAPTACVTQPTCTLSTGTIKVSAPANGPGISYTVTGTNPVVAAVTNTTGLFTGLTPGVYNVTTTNGGCVSAPTSLTVKAVPGVPAAPTANVKIQPSCIVSTGTIKVTAPANGPGISYTVTGITPAVAAVTNSTGLFPGLAPGVYNVTTTNGGCVSTATVLTVNAVQGAPAVPIASVTTQPTCVVSTGTITVTAPVNGPGISYTVTGINPAVAAVTNATGLFKGLTPGVYNVTVTNGGCVSAANTLTVKAVTGALAAPIACVTQPTCIILTGTIKVTVPANGSGISYTVTGITPVVAAVTNATGLFTGLTPGVYNVTATNGGCVSAVTTLTVKAVTGSLAAPIACVTQPTCIVSTGTIKVTSPANGSGISYTVTGITPVVAAVTNATGLFTGLTPGLYNVTATNGVCVSAATTLTVKTIPGAPAAPTACVTVQPSCVVPTGTIKVTAPANGYGISYTVTGINPVVAAVTNATGIFTRLTPGVYNVTVTNSGCISAATSLTVKATPGTPPPPIGTCQNDYKLNVYPNPFTDHLCFELQFKKDAKVCLEIYTNNGLKVATVFSKKVKANSYYRSEYTPVVNSTGVVLYRLIIDNQLVLNGKVIHK